MNNFHYAFKVKDIASTKQFYINILGCAAGRETKTWVDFDFFGHQLSAHVSDDLPEPDYCGLVDGIKVPIPHFGCLLKEKQFAELAENMERNGVHFLIKPVIRYKGQTGEQRIMFVLDFSNNPLEFKCYSNPEDVFAA